MTAAPRIRLARLLTALCALWPLAHYGLVRALELDPWRFGGFAMYAAPRPAWTAREPLMAPAGEPLRAIALEALPGAARERVLGVLAEALEAQSIWGARYAPEPYAAALLELAPSAAHVALSAQTCALDRAAFARCRTVQHVCARAGAASARCTRASDLLAPGDRVAE